MQASSQCASLTRCDATSCSAVGSSKLQRAHALAHELFNRCQLRLIASAACELQQHATKHFDVVLQQTAPRYVHTAGALCAHNLPQSKRLACVWCAREAASNCMLMPAQGHAAALDDLHAPRTGTLSRSEMHVSVRDWVFTAHGAALPNNPHGDRCRHM